MTIEITVTVLISVISVSAAIYFGIKSNRRADRQDVDEQKKVAAADASSNTAILIKLEAIGVGVTEIKGDIKSMKLDVKDITERLIVVEQSTKSAHKRLDEHLGGERRE